MRLNGSTRLHEHTGTQNVGIFKSQSKSGEVGGTAHPAPLADIYKLWDQSDATYR